MFFLSWLWLKIQLCFCRHRNIPQHTTVFDKVPFDTSQKTSNNELKMAASQENFTSNPRVDPPGAAPPDSASEPRPGYHAQRGSGAAATQPARMVPGAARARRAVAAGGEEGTSEAGARKRLAASALSPDPKVSADSDTARLQELVLASLPKELTDGIKDVKSAMELAEAVRTHATMLKEHTEAIRILRGTAMEQESRIRASLAKLNLTVAAADKLDDAVELVEADQAAVTSDFAELKAEVQTMRTVIEAKEIEQDAKLVRLVEQRHIDVRALSKELEDKMALVEVTFVKVEGLMFELSRDRQRYDQLLNEVQCSASTSGSSVLPSAGGPEMILLKSRVEKMSREISDLNGSVCGVRQAVAVVEDSVLSKEVKLNELVMQTAHQTTQAAVQLVAEREQILCNQIECVIMEVSKGACQCPSGCPGQAVSHQADLPSINGAGCPGGGRAPFFGADGRYNAPGGHGGGGSGSGPGGGGGGRPTQPVAHDIFSDDGNHQKKLLKSSRSPFDSKSARDELPRFNGRDKAELWRKKVTYFLHSKNANMRNLLRWAELQTKEITEHVLQDAVHSADSLAMLSDDPEVLSYHLWGFLNGNLTDAAWDLFDGVNIENGLEVWRVVNLEITQKTQSELLALEDQVLTPHRVMDIKDIDRALVAWDAALRSYMEAGGTALSKHRQVGAIMRLIPIKVRDQALWEFDKFDGRPDVLRKWIKDRTQWFTKADVTRPGGARAHLFDGDLEEFMSNATEEDHNAIEGMSDGELCAFVRKRFLPGQRDARKLMAPRRESAPPRDKRDVTCPNCLKKGHTSQECRAAKVLSKDRKCFECGEAGHIASKCPNKDKTKSLTEEAASAAKPVWLGCVADSEDVPVHRRKMTPLSKAIVTRPEPRGCTLGDCIGGVFAQMAEIERAEAAAAEAERDDTEAYEHMPILEDSDDELEPQEQRAPEPEDDDDGPEDDAPFFLGSGGRSLVPTDEAALPKTSESGTAKAEPGSQTPDVPSVPVNGEHAGRVGRRGARRAGPSLTEAFQASECHGQCGDADCQVADSPVLDVPSVPVNGEHAGRGGRRGAHPPGSRPEGAAAGVTLACPDGCCRSPATEGLVRHHQRWAARRQAIADGKSPEAQCEELVPSWHQNVPTGPAQLNNFWGVEAVEELNVLPEGEPEFLEVEMTLDTGATVHAADRLDFPGCSVVESAGSKAGQQFQAAGGKLIPNEGQAYIQLFAEGIEMAMTVQIAKITRPLLSVTKMTESGEISVLCKKDEALVQDSKGKILARFHRKGGLYVCMMKYRNPKFRGEGFTRPHE